MYVHPHEGALVLEGTPLRIPFEIVNPAARRLSLSNVVLLPLQRWTDTNSGCFNDVHNSHQCFYALLGQ
jgi:hypothetical protein